MRDAVRRANVLITDGEQRASLAAVRSLGRAGHRVFVACTRERCLAAASKYAAGATRVADPLADPERFARDIDALIDRLRIDVLLPISEASLLAVLRDASLLAKAVVPFPPIDAFERVCDKALVGEVARGLGIRTPAQRVLDSPAARAALDDLGLTFPLVVKSSRSVVGSAGRRTKTGVAHVADAAALDRLRARLDADAYPLLLQERIVGPGTGAFLLRWDGEILATFCHRRLREKPPSGGVSVYRESVAPDERLLELSAALLHELRWQGVAMVEYKVDAATGTPYLMEINGRFWGSLQLAIDAGVDFPALLVDAALGAPVSPMHSYRAGVRSRWFWGDVDHLVARLRAGAAAAALPPDAPSRARVIADFLMTFAEPGRGEILRLDDPKPALRETIDWFRRR